MNNNYVSNETQEIENDIKEMEEFIKNIYFKKEINESNYLELSDYIFYIRKDIEKLKKGRIN